MSEEKKPLDKRLEELQEQEKEQAAAHRKKVKLIKKNDKALTDNQKEARFNARHHIQQMFDDNKEFWEKGLIVNESVPSLY